MPKDKPDLVYGTLDMLILKALQHDPQHGLADIGTPDISAT